MTKLMLIATLALLPVMGNSAEMLGGQLKANLIEHVGAYGQVVSGGSRVAMMDSIVHVGEFNGNSIMDLQAGFAGDARPDSDQRTVNWLAGGYVKLSSILRPYVNFADHWKTLSALEYGLSWTYDFTEKRDYVSVQMGLAFALQPKE